MHVSQEELNSCVHIEVSPIRELLLSVLEVDENYCVKLLSSTTRIDADDVQRNLATLKSIRLVTLANVSSDWDNLVSALRAQSDKI